MHEVLVAEVVEAALLEDLGTGLPPHGLAEGPAVLGYQLGHDAAEGAEHGPAGVDDLDLAVLGERLGVSRQAGRVPAVVTGELAWGWGRGAGIAKCRNTSLKRDACAS